MKRTAIISPSGKLYGSEQVLGDFLSATTNIYDVYVFAKGGFCKRLTESKRHRIHPWTNVKLLYLKLFFALLFNKYDTIFCNEAGHLRYIYFLSFVFRKKRFSICFRILEDCSRLQYFRKKELNNIKIIAVSEYMAAAIRKCGFYAKTIIDSYKMSARSQFQIKKIKKVGVIGRVTASKGLADLEQLLIYMKTNSIDIEVILFGTVGDESFKQRVLRNYGDKVKFMGFVADQKQIYHSVDAVWHFNCHESLGRIFFEALDYGKFFVGFNSGGIGESGNLLGLSSCLVKKDSNCWERQFLERTIAADSNIELFQQAANKIDTLLSPQQYVKEMETAIHYNAV